MPALALHGDIRRVVAAVADTDIAERVYQASKFRPLRDQATQKARILTAVDRWVVLPILPQRRSVHKRAAAHTLGKEQGVQLFLAFPQAHIANIEKMRHAKGGNLSFACQDGCDLLREA